LLVERGRLGSSLVEEGVGANGDVDVYVCRGYDRLFATCDGCHDGSGRERGRGDGETAPGERGSDEEERETVSLLREAATLS
jgi:hypothetical protein